MLIGVLSDSHGRAEATREAAAALRAGGARLLIHLGDICGTAVLEELLGIDCRIVLGNCDWPEEPLVSHAQRLSIAVDHPMGLLTVDGKRIAFTHGHRPELMQQAIDEGADYLLHGHTHEIRDERCGRTRIVNPGALFRASRYTAALLDPAADEVRFIEVARRS